MQTPPPRVWGESGRGRVGQQVNFRELTVSDSFCRGKYRTCTTIYYILPGIGIEIVLRGCGYPCRSRKTCIMRNQNISRRIGKTPIGWAVPQTSFFLAMSLYLPQRLKNTQGNGGKESNATRGRTHLRLSVMAASSGACSSSNSSFIASLPKVPSRSTASLFAPFLLRFSDLRVLSHPSSVELVGKLGRDDPLCERSSS